MCHVRLFYSPNLSAVKTEGLLAPLRFAPHSYRPLSKVRCCRRKNSGDYRRNCRTNPRPAPTLPKTALSLSLFVGERACSSRCTEYCHSHNNCKKTIIPRKSPTPLPPLSKGGGLTARHKPLYCCFLLVPRPPFLFTKPFCRQDGGIASPPSLRTTFLPPLVKGEVLSPEKIRATTGGIASLPFASHHILTAPCQR